MSLAGTGAALPVSLLSALVLHIATGPTTIAILLGSQVTQVTREIPLICPAPTHALPQLACLPPQLPRAPRYNHISEVLVGRLKAEVPLLLLEDLQPHFSRHRTDGFEETAPFLTWV